MKRMIAVMMICAMPIFAQEETMLIREETEVDDNVAQEAIKDVDIMGTFDDIISQFEEFTTQYEIIKAGLTEAQKQNEEMQSVMLDMGIHIISLQASIKRAEDWANSMGERLQENNEDLANAYNELDELDKELAKMKTYVVELERQLERQRKMAPIVRYSAFGLGIIGGGFLGGGIALRDAKMIGFSTGGILLIGGGWALGHWVLKLW